jgi:hypothetical protein
MPRQWHLSILRITKEIALGTDGPERVNSRRFWPRTVASAAESEAAETEGMRTYAVLTGRFPAGSGRVGHRSETTAPSALTH